MASQSTAELPSGQEMCHLCLLPVPTVSKHVHENSHHHQASRQVAAVALDRWRAHIAADSAVTDPDQDADAAENVTFCDICTEALPSASFSRHVTSRPHLIWALDNQVFEELVREYVDEEDLKLLKDPEQKDDDEPRPEKSDAKTTYTCHICELQVPSAFKSEHERSVHHRTRVALATAAARRTSAFLHNQTPIGVTTKKNIKMIELLKLYTGVDLSKKAVIDNEDVIEKEVVEKASQVEVKKRLTAKQYFTDILPYLQYTEALYTIIVDDTEYVTIKNTNGTCMRVHVANFHGIYSDSGNEYYDLKCRVCHGYNQYVTYSSEKDHDKLHVMSLGHIRHVLTPIDNVHGIRKIIPGQSLCVVCNVFMPDHAIQNHIFNDIHHTAALAEALKLGRNFKEGKNDLKILIYSAPPAEKTNYMNDHRNFLHNNVGFGGGISLPHGGHIDVVSPKKRPNVGLFGASQSLHSTASTGPAFGASQSLHSTASAGPAFGASTQSLHSTASTGTTVGAVSGGTGTFGSASASTGFGATASTGTFGTGPAITGTAFGSNPTGTVFGANSVSTGTTFGSPLGAKVGANSFNTQSFGASGTGTGFGATADSASDGSTANSDSFGAKPNYLSFGLLPRTGIFGVTPASTGSASTANSAGTTNNGTTTKDESPDIPKSTFGGASMV